MPNTSNDNGRVLEAIITKTLSEELNLQLSSETELQQCRDLKKKSLLSESLIDRFENQSNQFCNWVCRHFTVSDFVEIHRFADDASRQGDVTDIQIVTKNDPVNFSIKNNHFALKHQRPGTTIQRLGFSKKSREAEQFKEELGAIYKIFNAKASNVKNDATSFRELKSIDVDFISRELYLPVCRLIHEAYVAHGMAREHAHALFTFLVGKYEFHKVVFLSDKVVLFDFTQLPDVTSFVSTFSEANPSYINLHFNNGWKLKLRLHTASSRLSKSPSLKFDTQLVESTINGYVI